MSASSLQVYSDCGNKGSAHGCYGVDVPFVQPHLAKRLLDDAVPSSDSTYVEPSNARYSNFLSLAYHIVYHQGEASGIPSSRGVPKVSRAGSQYTSMLLSLAPPNELLVASNVTLDTLLEVLTKFHFAPTLDLARKYVQYAPPGTDVAWLSGMYPPSSEEKVVLHMFRTLLYLAT